jgi:hypothetical protein
VAGWSAVLGIRHSDHVAGHQADQRLAARSIVSGIAFVLYLYASIGV